MILTLTIPAPCEWITSNQRIHRMEQARRTRLWREAGRLAAAGQGALDTPVHIVAHVTKPRGGRYDPGNWYGTAKAAVDGVVEAGVLADDDHKHVLGPDMRDGGKGPEALTLTIETLPKQS
jgi:hypothetical protein